MNEALMEIFLGYCKKGIMITDCRISEDYSKEFMNFDYEKNKNDFIIKDKDKQLILYDINNKNKWQVIEYDDYLDIHNKQDDIDIYIDELIN